MQNLSTRIMSAIIRQAGFWLLFLTLLSVAPKTAAQVSKKSKVTTPLKIEKTDTEWKKLLTEPQYYVLRKKGTERAFTSPLNSNKEKGVYLCAGCKTPLFSSDTKFESGTGWPSFYKPLTAKAITEKDDLEFGMIRTEVLCSACGGHLGHVFDDGPPPTKLRYCINGVALNFEKK
jgi:peptide-methionine (R)-S-oxide reductase